MTQAADPQTEDEVPHANGVIAYGDRFSSDKMAVPRRSPYAAAPLIAQLLATYDQHPQWRINRRLDAPSALRAYEACVSAGTLSKNSSHHI